MKTATYLSNNDDVIDSRDVIDRIDELRSLIQDAKDNGTEPEFEDTEELKTLEALQEDAEGYALDWKFGATLVRDDYFVDYCEELVKDIGDLPNEIPHYIVIDWEATANNLKADYTSVDFDGVTYWVR